VIPKLSELGNSHAEVAAVAVRKLTRYASKQSDVNVTATDLVAEPEV
jgi:hypothetical protein